MEGGGSPAAPSSSSSPSSPAPFSSSPAPPPSFVASIDASLDASLDEPLDASLDVERDAGVEDPLDVEAESLDVEESLDASCDAGGGGGALGAVSSGDGSVSESGSAASYACSARESVS